MLKKSAKRFLALLCIISLIITGSIQLPSLYVDAAEDTAASDTAFSDCKSEMPEGYRVVTPLTFGVSDTKDAVVDAGKNENISLDKLLFAANVTRENDGTTTKTYMYYLQGPTSQSICRLQMIPSDDRIYFFNEFDYSGKNVMYRGDSGTGTTKAYGSSDSGNYFQLKPSEFGLTSFKGTELRIWITTEYVKAPWLTEGEADDLKIGIWINGELYTYDGVDTYFYVLDCKENTYKGELRTSNEKLAISSPFMGLNHVGMVGGEYASETGEFYGPTTSDLVKNKVMDGTTFQSSVRFEVEGGTLYYGAENVDDAVQLTSTADGIQVRYGGEDIVFMNQDNVGIDVLNHNFDLKLTTRDIDSNEDGIDDKLELDICVDNRHQSFELDGTTADLTAYVGVKTTGDATVLIGEFANEDPDQITWDLDDGNYTIEKAEDMTRLSVDGVSVDNIVLDQPGTYSVAVTENDKVHMTDVMILEQFAEFESKMQDLIQEGYRVVTPLTFGISDTEGTYTSPTGNNISLDKLLFNVNLTYDNAGGSHFYYLKNGDDGSVFQVQFVQSSSTLYFYNHFDYKSSSAMYFGDAADATADTTKAKGEYFRLNKTYFSNLSAFYNQELRIWITTEFVDMQYNDDDEDKDDLKIGIWVNGELYNKDGTSYFYVKDCKNLTYREYIRTSNACLKFSSPIMELDHMGMVGGEYASETGEFKTSDLVANKVMDGTTFQSSVRFKGEGGTLYYGSKNDEEAIKLTSTSNGIQITYGSEDIVFINKQNVDVDVLNHTFDLKLTTEVIDSDSDGEDDVKLDIYVDNKYKSFTLVDAASKLKAYVGVKTTGDATVLIGNFASETPEELDWCLDEGQLHRVEKKASMTRMSVDGVDTANKIITIEEPGTYSIVYAKSGQVYMQDAIAYRSYDLNDNNEIDIIDIVRMMKVANETTKEATVAALSPAGRKAMGYEESTWTDDKAQETLKAARQTLVETVEIEVSPMELMDKEPVYTYGFDFLGGTQVMPIGGFHGPIPSTNLDASFDVPTYISDKYFSLIEECGVNLILYSDVYYESQPASIKRILQLGEKYGIGITLKDRRYGELGDALTVEKATEFLSDYQKYKAFCGVHAVDEPTSGDYGVNATLDNTDPMSNYVKQINTLDELGVWSYGNLLPCSNYEQGAKYEKYVREWLETCNVKMLMWDKYVHSAKNEEADYFYNMSLGRELANEYGRPFWTFAQGGTQLAKGSNYKSEYIEADTPNEGQFLWNVNTCLAYGAKGISYFPLIQPVSFAELADGTIDCSRNGLIGADGSKNKWWYFAQKANNQIAAIDDVLMTSVNKGVIITSDKAKEDNKYSTCILDGTSWREMKNITGDVMVGCFNYQGKSAFYVVNYDMADSQNITMEFFDNYQFRVIQNATTSRHRAGNLELSLEAGEGVLVVME